MKETRFKQTEIGLIPEDWEIRKLGSIFKFIPNNTISRDNLVNQGTVMNVHYGDILIKYDSILDIKNNEIPFINDSVISNSKFNEFAKDGDILIADTAEDEMVCKATELYNIENRKLVSGLHTMWIRPITEFKPKYLGYFFNSTFYHNQILPLIQGTKVCSVSKGAIKDTYISIPLENEQNKIASALTSIDNLLLSLDKLIEKKRLIKQGAMQELLTGKKRLPGFTGEWIEKRLGEIGEIIKESINPQLYRNQSFSEYSMPAYDLNKQPEIKYGEEMFSNRTKIDGTVLLYNKLNVRQRRIWYIENCKQNSICSMEFLPYKVYRDYLKFFYYKLSIDSVVNYFVGISKGTSNSQKRISPNDFLDFKVKYPRELQEQKAIATVLSSIDKEIESLEDKKAKYEQIKLGMMQQLLTGKIRLIS